MADGRGDEAAAAGAFGPWLSGIGAALVGEADSVVPCGTCTACCTSSQFVLVGPDEVDTLAHIPPALLFPAPRMPPGHVVLGYDNRGHCPMLRDGKCSIYPHRPRACRVYDCRVFPAAGVDPGDGPQGAIAATARRWRFAYPTADDSKRHEAVRAAARFLLAHPEVVPDGATSPTATAVLAIELHRLFLGRSPSPDGEAVEAVKEELRRRRA